MLRGTGFAYNWACLLWRRDKPKIGSSWVPVKAGRLALRLENGHVNYIATGSPNRRGQGNHVLGTD
ncbi:hypothetical protein BN1263390076 [Stenotrophomonas maltophilia]|nr:hypothetical protein BN1263390076 [Stenotrophomonas maltophilia]